MIYIPLEDFHATQALRALHKDTKVDAEVYARHLQAIRYCGWVGPDGEISAIVARFFQALEADGQL